MHRVGHGSGPPRRPALKIGHAGRPIKPPGDERACPTASRKEESESGACQIQPCRV
jgi:hypothetical protein